MSRRRQGSFHHPFASGLLGLFFAAGCGGGDDPTTPDPDPGGGQAEVTVSPADFALIQGSTITLQVQVKDDDGNIASNPSVTWSSSNASVLSVPGSGSTVTVTAVATGSATITASSGSLSDQSSGDVVASATFSGNVQPVFSTSCALGGCHTQPNPQMGQDLSDGAAYSNIVNVRSSEVSSMDRIEPGDPLRSYLVHKIRGTHLAVGGSGVQMPHSAPPLAKATIDAIRAWVQAGAQNN